MTRAGIPSEGGAYALDLRLDKRLDITLPRKPSRILAPGRYIYCGSAYGPGGLRARLARHLAGPDRIHWHIDRLTSHVTVREWWAGIGARECELVDHLRARPDVDIPLPGFGASDCRRCPAHLIRTTSRRSLDRLLE